MCQPTDRCVDTSSKHFLTLPMWQSLPPSIQQRRRVEMINQLNETTMRAIAQVTAHSIMSSWQKQQQTHQQQEAQQQQQQQQQKQKLHQQQQQKQKLQQKQQKQKQKQQSQSQQQQQKAAASIQPFTFSCLTTSVDPMNSMPTTSASATTRMASHRAVVLCGGPPRRDTSSFDIGCHATSSDHVHTESLPLDIIGPAWSYESTSTTGTGTTISVPTTHATTVVTNANFGNRRTNINASSLSIMNDHHKLYEPHSGRVMLDDDERYKFFMFLKVLIQLMELSLSRSIRRYHKRDCYIHHKNTIILLQRVKFIVKQCIIQHRLHHHHQDLMPLQYTILLRIRHMVGIEYYWNLTRDYVGYDIGGL